MKQGGVQGLLRRRKCCPVTNLAGRVIVVLLSLSFWVIPKYGHECEASGLTSLLCRILRRRLWCGILLKHDVTLNRVGACSDNEKASKTTMSIN